jgi:hypothetical protein
MVVVEHSAALNQIIDAYVQNNRIVIKNNGSEEVFEAKAYHAKLDQTYTSSSDAVFRKINSFISENRTQFTQDQLSSLNRIVSNRMSRINARTTGLFAFILLFFNKNRRQQLTNEYQALTQLHSTLLTELNTSHVHTAPRSTSSNASLKPQLSPGPNGIPPAPPPPPPPPPLSLLSGSSTAKPSYRPLRPNPSPVLDDEPALVPIPTDRLPTPEEVIAFESYITAMTEFWGKIKADSVKLEQIQTQINHINEKIINNQQKIVKSEKGIKALSSQASEDVIFLKVGKSGQTASKMPFITEAGFKKKYPDQKNQELPTPTVFPSTQNPPSDPTVLTPPSSPIPLNSNWSGVHHPIRLSKASISKLLVERFAPGLSQSSSSPSLNSSHRQFTITSMLEIYRGVITICEAKATKYQQQLEDMDQEYKAIEESFKNRSINDIGDLVKQKELYIDTCRKLIDERKEMQTGKVTRKPSTTTITRPKEPTNLSEADQITALINQFTKDPANHHIVLQIQQLAHMDPKEVVKQFNQLFIANISEE